MDNAHIMTKEEQEEHENLVRQRSSNRSRPVVTSRELDSSSGKTGPTSKQPTNDGKIIQHSSRLNIGYADTRGKRPTMEDEITIIGELRKKKVRIMLQFLMVMAEEMLHLIVQKMFKNI